VRHHAYAHPERVSNEKLLSLALLSLVIGGCSSIDDDYRTEGKLDMGTAQMTYVLENGRSTSETTPRVTIIITVKPEAPPTRIFIKNWTSSVGTELLDVTVSDGTPMRFTTSVSQGKFTLCTVDAAGYPIDQFDVTLSKE